MSYFFTIKNKIIFGSSAVAIHSLEYNFHSETKRSAYDALLYIFTNSYWDHQRLLLTLEIANYVLIFLLLFFIISHKYFIPNLIALGLIGFHLLIFLPWNTIGGPGDNF